MRWARLFVDVESRLAAQIVEEERLAAWEYAEAEMAQLDVADRLRAHVDESVVVVTCAGTRISGVVRHVGADYAAVEEGPRDWLIPLVRVGWFQASASAREPRGGVSARLGLLHALRALARDRQSVRVATVDGGAVGGRLVRVGRDHVDVAGPRGVVTVATAAIDCLASAS
ncbi:hypothetical protein H8R18_01920 [Nanchangia anserum]|uniref:Uncharacterized protein n=1 Tax=Nanchangia anserum TaxID=2692125 RepID=A0A8I0GHH0_9ACTO|nr:hypothetical protein [Nanchangia anserum]MBD3690064.1 hypothetical protein [Nanchangia anserum]QOX82142.1 hypothetical protein H8R18_01920 [Nanchangia anserum]